MRASNIRVLSYALIGGAIVLLLAILLGNRMGTHAIFDANRTKQPPVAVTIAPSSEPTTASLVERLWKKEQIVRVAGDPGFPDPHVTPPPTATPRPTAPPPVDTPRPIITQNPSSNIPVWQQTYPPDAGPTPVGEGQPSGGASTDAAPPEPSARPSARAGRPRPSATPTDPHF